MRAINVFLLVVGVLLMIIGGVFVSLGMVATKNSQSEETQSVPAFNQWIMSKGMNSGEKITVSFTSSSPLSQVYVADHTESGLIQYPVKKLFCSNCNSGSFSYTTENMLTYYVIFENGGSTTVSVHAKVGMGSSGNSVAQNLCLIPGIAMLVGGLLCIILVLMFIMRQKKAAPQQPVGQFPIQYAPQPQSVQPYSPAPPANLSSRYTQVGGAQQYYQQQYQPQGQLTYEQLYGSPPPPVAPSKSFTTYQWDQPK